MSEQRLAHARTGTTSVTETIRTNKVIRSTYLLLSLTLAFSAVTAFVAMAINAPPVHWIVMIAVLIGGPFAIHAVRNSAWALLLTFAFTGLLGFFLGPILTAYLGLPNGPQIVGNALATTAVAFVALSGYALATRKDFSFLGGFLIVGLVLALVAIVANIFLAIPALSLAISAAVVLLLSAAILFDTSRMIHDPDANYIVMTVSLYANLYVMFLHLLNLFHAFTGDS
ncbi:Putative TEGT family carrier/transport protein [Thioalkalivibrio nitratireducens DSM 14787]|uniref:TEGT family carrier/transport protein n=1 Tax=Thioalkalivibrio nitratireducens (strain DSM 14787 / UNIQEM 213 / ALEN2) TaxID=1255043 RepID=L0DVZ5_THIND|nr:Bax inhibitor-1/YccA family protein [Thioalkalivibrio nitratireducens]AGA33769.1 Putative TEGT family carrier/transport protein [Thioalkalivibrio nitratireducens DSM 14787]